MHQPGVGPVPPGGQQPPIQMPMPGMPSHPVPPMGMQGFGPPVVAPPAASALPALDIQKTSVGYMSNVTRAQVKLGHKRYFPLDMSRLSQVMQPFVEPGRLEARVNEFYRRLKQKMEQFEPPPLTVPGPGPSRLSLGERHHDDRERERYRDTWEEEGGRGRAYSRGSDLRSEEGRDRDRSSGVSNSISEDNMGHVMLRGLGWQQGDGLGAGGTGRVEPILESGNKDRQGVGAGVDPLANTPAFASFRSSLSNEYHNKIIDREASRM